MTDFTDVFGSDSIPPSNQAYSSHTLTANAVFNWPMNYTGSGEVLSSINDIDASSGVTITLPSANEVSKGQDTLIRNIGSNSIDINDADDTLVTTIAAGSSKYLFVTDNSSAAGEWAVVSFGVGTSSVDAASLIGYGIKAISDSLNQSHPVETHSSATTIDSTHRSKVIVHTGGVVNYTLPSAISADDDFFFAIRNNGVGTVTIVPDGSDTIDSAVNVQIQPGESTFVFCSGSAWFTVGIGRSVQYNFTQLTPTIWTHPHTLFPKL